MAIWRDELNDGKAMRHRSRAENRVRNFADLSSLRRRGAEQQGRLAFF
jgi:hypothetical protein